MGRGRGRRRRRAANSCRSHLRWVMLDRSVHRKGNGDKVVADGVLDGTRSKNCSTCTGVPIAISIRVAEPPAMSRLYIHWLEGFRPELSELKGPFVIAAHSHSILLKAYVPFVKCSQASYYYPFDYFVYTASRSEESPSLRRLPACFWGRPKNPEQDKRFDPYRCHQQRCMSSEDIGLLCRGDEEFVVAELSYGGEFCMVHHAPGEDKAMEWSFEKLPLPFDESTPDLLCGSWQNDMVIPFGDSYLCWVDCYLGLLFVGVLGEPTKIPRYVPLPADLNPRRLYIDKGSPDPARRVCVTDTGMIKLICVSDREGCTVYNSRNSSCPDFTIRIWTLINFEEKKWVEDAHMEASEFWAALYFDKRLPRVLPEFPVMSLVDPDVICFRLVDPDSYRLIWLIEVNMKKKVLGAITLYIHEEEEEGCSVDEPGRLSFPYYCFIPSQFTQYMDKHGIKSLEFSEKLQKAKLERAIDERLIKE